MHPRRARSYGFIFVLNFMAATIVAALATPPQLSAQTSASSSSAKHGTKPAATSALEPGSVSAGVYRNKSLSITCKIPQGWVLRTEEMNAPAEEKNPDSPAKTDTDSGAKVLLAAFSRPPEAKGEDVNASILIAAESAAAYPGLTAASQYFGPLTEVAKAQGFTIGEEPYEMDIGSKTLVRGDFHKDVGTRRMLQSTLALLAHGYAVSITVIGGTEDEVEELIDGLSFAASTK